MKVKAGCLIEPFTWWHRCFIITYMSPIFIDGYTDYVLKIGQKTKWKPRLEKWRN